MQYNCTKLKGFAFMFLSSSLMGGIGAFARYINTSGDVISFFRNFLGFVCISLIIMSMGNIKKVKSIKISPAIIFSGIFLGLLSMLYVISTQKTTLSNAAFLIYTGPIYSTILASLFLKEPFTKVTFFMLLSVFIGCLLIIGVVVYDPVTLIAVNLELDPQYATGNFIALMSGVAYGLFLFASRFRTDVDSDVRSFYNFTFASLTIGVYLAISIPDLSAMDASSWGWLIAAAVITGFGAFFLLTIAAKYLLASELACISYQETVMATLLGVMLFSEPITLMQSIGGCLIIFSGLGQVLFSTRKSKIATEPVPN